MKKLLSLTMFLGLWLSQRPAFAHKEWVHQHMVQQSYLFLEQQIGVIPALRTAVGLGFRGRGDDSRPFNTDYPIAIGAWREDSEDPVYHYDLGNGGFTPSITHFWDADQWDENYESAPLNIGYTSKAPNAWEKARVYLYCQDRNGMHDITIPYVMPGQYTQNFIITYNSLAELYKGNYYLEATTAVNGTGRVNYYHSPQFDPAFGRPVALQILGRVAHLLGDMSVPAHAHTDLHPCPLGLPDFYENNMGNVYWSNNGTSDCENDPGGSFRAQDWNAATAAQQGGLLEDMFCQPDTKSRMKYLFYTTNQLADFFPSGVNGYDPSGPVFNNQNFEWGDTYLGNGPTNSFLRARYAALGGYSPSSINHITIANETFNYSIRAVATLFQWFAFEAGIIQDLRNQKLSASGSLVCQGGSLDFNLPATTGPNATANWSVEPSWGGSGTVYINPTTGSQYYHVAPAAGYSGLLTVKASYSIADNCYSGPRTLSSQVWVGGPWADMIKGPATELVCPGLTMYFEAGVTRSDLTGPLTYQWSSNLASFRNPGNSPQCAIIAPNSYDKPVEVTCVVSNSCSSSTITRYYTTANPAGVNGRIPCNNDNPNGVFSKDTDILAANDQAQLETLEVFPNPSNSGFEVVVPATLLKKAAGAKPTVLVYMLRDNLGRTVAQGSQPTTKVQIDTRNLPAGVYFLSCTLNGQPFHRRVQVLH